MRGRSNDYYFIDPMIMEILEKSKISVQALNINFKINESSGKIINLNAIKSHLENLVQNNKISKKVKGESIFYSSKKK